MFKNYFKTAIRNLWRYKGFAFINILSLTIGIAGCLAIALFVWDERKYDKSIPGFENIYRVYEQRSDNGTQTVAAISPPMFATFLKQQYPEIEDAARIMMTGDRFLLEQGEKKGYEDKGLFVDEDFFKIFPLTFISGDKNTALKDSGTVVLSADLAKRYWQSGGAELLRRE